ncbi:phage tail protein [Caulobacter sp. FWC2]|uniref:phage tail protein n=1 Tax=Caulobacter sp. FWC2 TaxID=69664 RepID=UPI000C15EB79|nr:tail fiber protein [Caulobacter sp. FWC2]PIB92132.1 phage tail protein [Caulobacter sp. FWC2]
MSDQYLGEIRMFGGTFAPLDWLICNGALLPISNYDALYVLLGTQWGGDGVNTFGIPDLRTRLPVGQGQSPGLSSYVLGQKAGTNNVTLTMQNMPPHNHGFAVSTQPATTKTLSNNAVFAAPTTNTAGAIVDYISSTATPAPTYGALDPRALSASPGMNGAHVNQMPSLTINFIIATSGIFPSRP